MKRQTFWGWGRGHAGSNEGGERPRYVQCVHQVPGRDVLQTTLMHTGTERRVEEACFRGQAHFLGAMLIRDGRCVSLP